MVVAPTHRVIWHIGTETCSGGELEHEPGSAAPPLVDAPIGALSQVKAQGDAQENSGRGTFVCFGRNLSATSLGNNGGDDGPVSPRHGTQIAAAASLRLNSAISSPRPGSLRRVGSLWPGTRDCGPLRRATCDDDRGGDDTGNCRLASAPAPSPPEAHVMLELGPT